MNTESTLTVRLSTDDDKTAWDQFVYGHPQSTFFHRYGWAKVIEKSYGHASKYLTAVNGENKIVGVLPLTYINSPFFGKSLISTAFTIGGGALASDLSVECALYEEAAKIGQKLRVQYIEYRGGSVNEHLLQKQNTYATFCAKIAASSEEALLAVPRKKRADLRKALKLETAGELSWSTEAELTDVYRLYARNVRALGTPVWPQRWLESLCSEFGSDIELSLVLSGRRHICSLISFYHKGTVLPYYAGSQPEARTLHGYDFMYWKQMRHSFEKRGAVRFDFGRSKQGTGAYDYKTYWGFEPAPLSYQYKLIGAKQVPDINPNNPKFKLVTEAWKRLPLFAANRIGPFLAGNLA